MRFNLYNSIPVNVNPADGYSSGQAQQAIKEVAAQLLLRTRVTNTAVWHVRKLPAAERNEEEKNRTKRKSTDE